MSFICTAHAWGMNWNLKWRQTTLSSIESHCLYCRSKNYFHAFHEMLRRKCHRMTCKSTDEQTEKRKDTAWNLRETPSDTFLLSENSSEVICTTLSNEAIIKFPTCIPCSGINCAIIVRRCMETLIPSYCLSSGDIWQMISTHTASVVYNFYFCFSFDTELVLSDFKTQSK